MKTTSCNGDIDYAFNTAPRCGAKTKRSGEPCLAPAVRTKKRCRIHGGSAGSGAQKGNTNALKHGLTTRDMKAFKKAVKEALEGTAMYE